MQTHKFENLNAIRSRTELDKNNRFKNVAKITRGTVNRKTKTLNTRVRTNSSKRVKTYPLNHSGYSKNCGSGGVANNTEKKPVAPERSAAAANTALSAIYLDSLAELLLFCFLFSSYKMLCNFPFYPRQQVHISLWLPLI